MNPRIQRFKDKLIPKVPECYYHTVQQQFVMKQTKGDPRFQNWVMLPEHSALEFLSDAGIRAEKTKEEVRSPAAQYLLDIKSTSEKSVQFVGPVAGYRKGFISEASYNALVTTSPNIPKAIKGDCSYPLHVINSLFGPQAVYIFSYMQMSRRMLIAGNRRGMPAIIMLGPRNCGKSFFQLHIMTPFLGGRMCMADRFLTGKDMFNGDIWTAEHIVVGDATLSTRMTDRRDLGNRIKNIVANEVQSMRALFKDAIQVTPFSRLTISLNDEFENRMGLPMMDDSIRDKIMLFLVNQVEWPVVALTPEEVSEFQDAVHAQIPAFCWWLENEFVMPTKLMYDHCTGKPARFCIDCYQSPELVRGMVETSPEFRLLELIHQCCFIPPTPGSVRKAVESDTLIMDPHELESALKSNDSPVQYDARKLLSSGTRIATLLNRLSQSFPKNIYQKRTSKSRLWVLFDIDKVISEVVKERGDCPSEL